ncbi:MAG: hypothetical protein GXP40_02520 [Chloroflexi bacterium]|nr:hypothetical protein [Chloroflexota bacterium]
MSAPIIWILLPLGLSLLVWLPRRGHITAMLGGLSALALSGAAWLIPVDTALRIGPWSLKIAASVQILGRRILISPADQPMLTMIYGLAALWFFGAHAAGLARRLVPLGMAITALLVGSLAVEPFLYAALLIEMAVLLAIPLLSPPNQKPGRGVVRFLIYQTLGMPFILFSGWLLAGVEASPGDLALAVQSATLLGLGFAFLLAIFPLYTWIPLLTEESSPYAVGFILWILPTITLLFGTGFLDRYSWLRESPQMLSILRSAGLLMITTGGLWAAFQRHLGRMMGYAAITGVGFALLALSLEPEYGLAAFFLLIIPRAIGLAIWALSLSVLTMHGESLRFRTMLGKMQAYPVASTGIILAHLSATGLPLLAGFPAFFVIWEGLARQSIGAAIWLGLGLAGLFTGAVRTLAVLVMSSENTPWEWRETWLQDTLIGLGVIVLFMYGLFPQWLQPLLVNLPAAFEHLGQ